MGKWKTNDILKRMIDTIFSDKDRDLREKKKKKNTKKI